MGEVGCSRMRGRKFRLTEILGRDARESARALIPCGSVRREEKGGYSSPLEYCKEKRRMAPLTKRAARARMARKEKIGFFSMSGSGRGI